MTDAKAVVEQGAEPPKVSESACSGSWDHSQRASVHRRRYALGTHAMLSAEGDQMGCATGGNRSRRPGLVSWPRPLHDTCGLLEARTSCWYGKFRNKMVRLEVSLC